MTLPPFPPMFVSPFDWRYDPRARLVRQLSEPAEPPLRARSVLLSRRAQSCRDTPAGRSECRHGPEKFLLGERASKVGRTRLASQVPPKKQPPLRIPCAVSVQNLSIPVLCDPDYAHTSPEPKRTRKRKHNPSAQACGGPRTRQTENRLLIQISEAEQVSDFERILKSNAILCDRRAPRVDDPAPARPRSSYCVSSVSEAYHHLFQRHIDSVQRLICDYREQERAERAPDSLLRRRSDDLDLSVFYDDDRSLQEELRAAADRRVDEELLESPTERPARNFNVNLSGLIVADLPRDLDASAAEPGGPRAGESDEEWDAMSALSDRRDERTDSVSALVQNLDSIHIEKNSNVPTITFSNYCDNNARCPALESSVAINLSVPRAEPRVEARPS